MSNKPKAEFKKNEYVYFQHITYQIDEVKFDNETDSYWCRLKRSGQLIKVWVEEKNLQSVRIR